MNVRNFGNNDLSISRGWTGMQQVLGRGGEARLKVRNEGGGNKSRRARASRTVKRRTWHESGRSNIPDITKLSKYLLQAC